MQWDRWGRSAVGRPRFPGSAPAFATPAPLDERAAAAWRRAGATLACSSSFVAPLLFVGAVVFYDRAWPDAPIETPDTPGYLEVAADLADARLDALHDRTPGYPLLLVAAGATRSPTRRLFHATLALHLVAVALLLRLLAWEGIGRRGRLLFAGVALLPPYVEPAAFAMSETTAALLLVGAVVGYVGWLRSGSRPWCALAALAAAGAALTRPTYQALGPVFLGTAVLMRARMSSAPGRGPPVRGALAVAVASLGVVLALSLHNGLRFGYAGVTPLFGFNLSTRTTPVLELLPDAEPLREPLIAARDRALVERGKTHTAEMSIWSATPELERITGLPRPQLSSRMLRLNLWLIRRAPFAYLREVARSAAIYWLPDHAVANFGSATLNLAWALVQFAVLATFGSLLGLGFAARVTRAALRMRGGGGEIRPAPPPCCAPFLLATAIALYTALVSCTVECGNPRYRAPTDLLLLAGCVCAGRAWWAAWRPPPVRSL
jgi:hypothetical protein